MSFLKKCLYIVRDTEYVCVCVGMHTYSSTHLPKDFKVFMVWWKERRKIKKYFISVSILEKK